MCKRIELDKADRHGVIGKGLNGSFYFVHFHARFILLECFIKDIRVYKSKWGLYR